MKFGLSHYGIYEQPLMSSGFPVSFNIYAVRTTSLKTTCSFVERPPRIIGSPVLDCAANQPRWRQFAAAGALRQHVALWEASVDACDWIAIVISWYVSVCCKSSGRVATGTMK